MILPEFRQTKLDNMEIDGGENSEESNEERDRKSLASLITIYLKFAYYIIMSPFKISDVNRKPTIVTGWLPKLSWALLLVPCSLFRVAESRDIMWDFGNNWEWNPTGYFRMFHGITKVIFHVTLWYYLGFKSDSFLNVVKFIHESRDLPIPRMKPTFWKMFVPGVALSIILWGPLIGPGYIGRFQECPFNGNYLEDFQRMLQFCVEWGRYSLFLTTKRVRCNDLPGEILNSSSFSSSEIAFGVTIGGTSIFRLIHSYYEELLLSTGVSVFWLCSREFSKRLNGLELLPSIPCKSLEGWDYAYAWYSALRELSILIKQAYGGILLQRLIHMIVDIPISFDYGRESYLNQIRFLMFFFVIAVVYIMAADASKQIKTFEAFTTKMVDSGMSSISHQRLFVILHELQANTVGVSTNIGFTITYSFVANVSGILITYFIICLQNSTAPIKTPQ